MWTGLVDSIAWWSVYGEVFCNTLCCTGIIFGKSDINITLLYLIGFGFVNRSLIESVAGPHVTSRAIADGHAAFHPTNRRPQRHSKFRELLQTHPTTDIRIFIPSIDILILSRYRLTRPVLVDTGGGGNKRHHGSQGHLLPLGGYELDTALYRE